MIRKPALIGAAGLAAAGAVLVAMPGQAAAAETVVQTISLDEDINSDGSGTVDAFDPALGTLTSVAFAVTSEVELQTCLENNSPVSRSTSGGPFEGSVSITFPADVVTSATNNVALPAVTLGAYDGSDGCVAAYDPATVRFTSTPSQPDLQFVDDAANSDFAETLTAPADLAPYVGPGTVPYSWVGTSFEGVTLNGEWDLWFVGHGAVSITITYTYEPAQVPTTTTAPPTTAPPSTGGTTPPTTAPPSTNPTACIPPGGTAPSTAPGSPTTLTAPRACASLPSTGSTTDATTAAALFALAAGLALLGLTRRKPQLG